jgi:hypothetical protein
MAAAAPGHYREASRALKPVIDDMTRARLHTARWHRVLRHRTASPDHPLAKCSPGRIMSNT